MGYCFYFDWCNVIDVFVKVNDSVVLFEVG